MRIRFQENGGSREYTDESSTTSRCRENLKRGKEGVVGASDVLVKVREVKSSRGYCWCLVNLDGVGFRKLHTIQTR